MFDVEPFTESTAEEVLNYIETELLEGRDPIEIYISNRILESSRKAAKEMSDMDTLRMLVLMR